MEHLRDRQRVEQARQLILDVRGSIARGGATQADGCLPDRLDAREPFLTGLRSQHVAQHPAEQTRVFLEWEILVRRRIHVIGF